MPWWNPAEPRTWEICPCTSDLSPAEASQRRCGKSTGEANEGLLDRSHSVLRETDRLAVRAGNAARIVMKHKRILTMFLALIGLAIVIKGILLLQPRPTPPKPQTAAHVLTGHRHGIRSLAFSADGSLLASGGGAFGSEGEAIIWNLAEGSEVRRLTQFSQPVEAAAFSPDGFLLAAAAYHDSVSVWGVVTGRRHSVFAAHKSSACSLLFSPNHQSLILAGLGPDVVVWDLDSGTEQIVISGEVGPKALSPDGASLAMGSTPGGVVTRQGGGGQLTLAPLAVGETPRGNMMLCSLSICGDENCELEGSD